MINDLVISLYNKIITANYQFLDVVGGLVHTVTEQMPTEGNTAAINQQRYPVTEVHNQIECTGKELPMIPDGNKKSLLYFEDLGSSSITWLGRAGWSTGVRLVFWCNRARLVADGYNEQLIGQIAETLIELLAPRKHSNGAGFTRLLGEAVRVPVQDASIFSKYTYLETDKQYLRPPYDFFAVDFTFKYNIGAGCQVPIVYGSDVCL